MSKNDSFHMKERLQAFSLGLLALVFAFTIFGYLSNSFNRGENGETRSPEVSPIIDIGKVKSVTNENDKIFGGLNKYKKYQVYSNFVTPDSLIQYCEDKKEDKAKCSEEIAKITQTITVSGHVGSALLYVKSGVSRNNNLLGPLTQFDSVWFYMDDSGHSGQLLRSKALASRQSEDGVTELVFDLNKLPVTGLPYSDSAEPKYIDITNDKLNLSGNHYLGSFVSTLGFGKIIDMTIYYDSGTIE